MCVNDKYRGRLLQLYKRCLLSGYDALQCDAAHIVPQFICYRFSLQHMVEDIYNGLILTKDLHYTFDHFYWCCDIYDVRWEANGNWCQLPIIVKPNRKKLSCNDYEGQLIRVPVRSLPYLWIDYQLFMFINYQDGKFKERYNELLGGEDYFKIYENPQILQNFPQKGVPSLITGKRGYGREYQVLFTATPWSQRTWVKAEQLPQNLISSYENYQESNLDLEWKPRS